MVEEDGTSSHDTGAIHGGSYIAMSSTPAVVEEDGTSSHDTGGIHDGSYMAASNGMSVPWCMFY